MFRWFRFHCDPAACAVLKLAGEFGGLLKRALSISQRTTPRALAQMNEHARGKWAQFSHISTRLSTSLSSSLQINALILERHDERVRLYHTVSKIYEQTNTKEQNISDTTDHHNNPRHHAQQSLYWFFLPFKCRVSNRITVNKSKHAIFNHSFSALWIA